MGVMRLPSVALALAISQALAFGMGGHRWLACSSFAGWQLSGGLTSPFACGLGLLGVSFALALVAQMGPAAIALSDGVLLLPKKVSAPPPRLLVTVAAQMESGACDVGRVVMGTLRAVPCNIVMAYGHGAPRPGGCTGMREERVKKQGEGEGR